MTGTMVMHYATWDAPFTLVLGVMVQPVCVNAKQVIEITDYEHKPCLLAQYTMASFTFYIIL